MASIEEQKRIAEEEQKRIAEIEYALYVLVGRHLGLQAILRSLIRQTNNKELCQKLLKDLDRAERIVYWDKFEKTLKREDPKKEQKHLNAMSDGFSDIQDDFIRDLKNLLSSLKLDKKNP